LALRLDVRSDGHVCLQPKPTSTVTRAMICPVIFKFKIVANYSQIDAVTQAECLNLSFWQAIEVLYLT
jgi:hypothetical protein